MYDQYIKILFYLHLILIYDAYSAVIFAFNSKFCLIDIKILFAFYDGYTVVIFVLISKFCVTNIKILFAFNLNL